MKILLTFILALTTMATNADSPDDLMRDIRKKNASVMDIALLRLDTFGGLFELETKSTNQKLAFFPMNNRIRTILKTQAKTNEMTRQNCEALLQKLKESFAPLSLATIAFPYYSAEFRQETMRLFTYQVIIIAEDNKDLKIQC